MDPHLQSTRRVGEEVVLQNLPIEHIEFRCTVYSLGLVPGPADHVSDCRGVNCAHEFVMEAIANKNGGFPAQEFAESTTVSLIIATLLDNGFDEEFGYSLLHRVRPLGLLAPRGHELHDVCTCQHRHLHGHTTTLSTI